MLLAIQVEERVESRHRLDAHGLHVDAIHTLDRHQRVGRHVGGQRRRLDVEQRVAIGCAMDGDVVEVHVPADVHPQPRLREGTGSGVRGAARELHGLRTEDGADVVGRAVEEFGHGEMAEGDDLLAFRRAARHHVRQPRDHMRLVPPHLVVAVIAGAGERVAAGRQIDVRIQSDQPQALDRFDDVRGVRQLRTEGLGRLRRPIAGAVVADRGHAVGPLRLLAGAFEVVVAAAVRAVRRRVVAVLRFGHESVTGERGGDAGMPQVPHVLGAVHRARGAGLRAVGRIAAGRMPAPAVDRLRAERAGLGVPAEIIRLAARLVVGAHRIVIAGHGEELDAVAVRIRVEDAHESTHVHRLPVVGKIAGQRDDAHASGDGVVERGEKRECVLVEQPGRGQLRLHCADRRRLPGARIDHPFERAGFERRVDVVEMHVGHEGDAHRGLRPGPVRGVAGGGAGGGRQQRAQRQGQPGVPCARRRLRGVSGRQLRTRRSARRLRPGTPRCAAHRQKSARRPRLTRRPDSSYIVGNDGSIV